jgi:hypothetical protein
MIKLIVYGSVPLERQEKVKVTKMKAYQDDFTSGTKKGKNTSVRWLTKAY